MESNKDMCRIIKPYTCVSCGNDLLFFANSRNNHIIDYKELINVYKSKDMIMDYLYNQNIEFLKCLACKKTYMIDWTGKLPRPLIFKSDLIKFGYKL